MLGYVIAIVILAACIIWEIQIMREYNRKLTASERRYWDRSQHQSNYFEDKLSEEKARTHELLMQDEATCIARNFWLDTEKLFIRHYPFASGTFTYGDLYSWVQEVMERADMMDVDTPFQAISLTPTGPDLRLINGWEIDPKCEHFLTGRKPC
jgi:hypothetical protein